MVTNLIFFPNQYVEWISTNRDGSWKASPNRPLISCSNVEIVLSNILKTAPLKDIKFYVNQELYLPNCKIE